jgi:ABC-type transporter Mla subunit MlaD
MSDVDAGDVKAKAGIEYDPSGMKQFKEDLASLPQMVGGLGQSAGDAGEKLSELDKGMTSNAESAKSFTSALSELPKITESGTAAVSEMSGVLSEQRSAIEETASAHETLQKSVESSVSAFEKAPSSIRAVSEHTQFLQEQMSVASDSFSQAGSSIAQVTPTFREAFNIPTDAVLQFDDAGRLIGDSAKYFETASSGAQSFGKSFQGSSSDVQTFAGQVGNLNTVVAETHKGMNGISETAFSASKAMDSAGASTGQWVEASNGFMAKLGDVMEGPAYSKPVKMGDAFGEVMGGVTGALNDIAMPLMAVQMIAQTVQQVGQAMYDSAAIAEGPAAHSFGTFTGTVDALGQSLQNASGQFSEGFGQSLIPTLNALNGQAGSSDLGGLGKFAGGVASTLPICH